MYSLSGSGK